MRIFQKKFFEAVDLKELLNKGDESGDPFEIPSIEQIVKDAKEKFNTKK